MLRKTVSRIMLILILISMLTFAFHVQPVKADPGTWIVDDERAPPLDHAGMMGTGSREPPSYAKTTSDYARTGTKSVKLYQIPPTKSDAQRRVTCQEWSSIDGQTEFYWSWWTYFPDNMGNAQSGIWTNLGGLSIRYGPLGDKQKYYSGVGIFLNDATPRRLYARYFKNYNAGSNHHCSDFYLNSTYLNTWLHLQCYVKYSNTSTGVYRVWIGDGTTTQKVLEETGLSNDPRSDSRWESESLYFAYPPDGFYVEFQLYQPKNSPESWYYADDFVLSDMRVSETYGVSFGSEDIIFETGYESGTKPFGWQDCTCMPGGCSSSSMTSSTTHVHAGTKSVKLHQSSPLKSDAERRIEMRWYDTPKDVYVSYWIYFDDRWNVDDTNGWGTTMGGCEAYFGPSSNRWKFWIAVRFVAWMHPDDGTAYTHRRIKTQYETGNGANFNSEWDNTGGLNWTNFYLCDNLNQWIHFQVHLKLASDNTGVAESWINGVQTLNLTGIKTDPEGYSEWNSMGCAWARGDYGGAWVANELYQDRDSFESWYWIDDTVVSTTKVPEDYVVGGVITEFEGWEDDFESGNFDNWNGTQTNNGEANITSTYSHQGSYSANFTTNGSDQSYARAMHDIQPVKEVYQRSYVRFEDLPDTTGTRILALRMAKENGGLIVSAGINKIDTNYYWHIYVQTTGTQNGTQATINADQWYCIELYFNATTNGCAKLWIDDVLMCELTGDFSGAGDIERVYPYIYIVGNQSSAKTVYHDNYCIDYEKIGSGTSTIFSGAVFYEGGE